MYKQKIEIHKSEIGLSGLINDKKDYYKWLMHAASFARQTRQIEQDEVSIGFKQIGMG